MQGEVLQAFAYDEANPYAAGQHRGVDIGAGAAGQTVIAPAAGTVTFAGTVPTSGKSVTIETADGYAVTLTHLGSIGVAEETQVAEQDPVGTIGPSGTPEVDAPYLHLGVRVAADPNGYVDPLGLLPAAAASGASDGGTTVSQPGSSGSASTAPASAPAPAAPTGTPVTTPGPTPAAVEPSDRSANEQRRAQGSRPEARPKPSLHRSVVRAGAEEGVRTPRAAEPRGHRVSEPTGSSRRPVVEPAALGEPIGRDAGHEARPSIRVAQPRRAPSDALLALLCNGAAAVFALGAALATDRRRRRPNTSPTLGAQVLHLPRSAVGRRHVSRAA